MTEWIVSAAENEGFSIDELNYILCTDNSLSLMNMKYLQHDTLTDVLTFDNSEQEKKITGEIYISLESVRGNAKKYKQTVTKELHRVMVHGLLHLCGYDDKTSNKKNEMTEKENFYLRKAPSINKSKSKN